MMTESIEVIKDGVCIGAFPTESYILNVTTGIVTIHCKESRKLVFALSPNYYDYIEVTENVQSDA